MHTRKDVIRHLVACLVPTVLICSFLLFVGAGRYHRSKEAYLAQEARMYDRGFRPSADIIGGVILAGLSIGIYQLIISITSGRLQGED